jgi:hypothetical protein
MFKVAVQQSQQQTVVAAPEYAAQIRIARQAALEIYEHGMLGNSGSAINNKPGRPPGMSVAVAVDGKLVWAEGFGLADLEQCVPASPRTKFRTTTTPSNSFIGRASTMFAAQSLAKSSSKPGAEGRNSG